MYFISPDHNWTVSKKCYAIKKNGVQLCPKEEIPEPHISLLEVKDEGDTVRKNFKQFVGLMVQELEGLIFQGMMMGQFLCYTSIGVEGYSNSSGFAFWCLEDADRVVPGSNTFFKGAATHLYTSVNSFLAQYATTSRFKMQMPGEIITAMAQTTQEQAQSCAEYSANFPHLSIARGYKIDTKIFDITRQSNQVFPISGVKVIYNYGSNRKKWIPQAEIRKFYGDINVYSQFGLDSLQYSPVVFPSMQDFFWGYPDLSEPAIEAEVSQRKANSLLKSKRGKNAGRN